MTMIRRFRAFDLPASHSRQLLETISHHKASEEIEIAVEHCFYIDTSRELEEHEEGILDWLLAETFEPHRFARSSFLDHTRGLVLEVGPRMSFTTAWSTNAVSVCRACGLDAVTRIERSRRFLLQAHRDLTHPGRGPRRTREGQPRAGIGVR
ncbi:MAG: hypothetical protein P8Y93_03645 [Acidobacteriota bacterium]